MTSSIRSLYLHFPFCRHLCNYCDFYKKLITEDGKIDEFHEYLEESWNVHESLLKENDFSWAPLKTLYIGGGTPSLWGREGSLYLEAYLKNRKVTLEEKCEFTLEVNPGSWTSESINAWRDFGANRFSLGVQTLNPNVIKFLDRVHSIDDVYETLSYFNSESLNFSVDFMLGLPDSVGLKRDIVAELKELIDKFDPPHFSIYILTVKKQYIHFDKLPDDVFVESEYLEVSNFLRSKGYNHYEVSNFAKPGFESKHNISYWDLETVAALGPSATGFLSKGIRYKWKPLSKQYVEEKLNDEQMLLEKVYLSLRTNKGFQWSDFISDTDTQLTLGHISLQWQERGLVTIKDKVIYPTPKGYLVMDGLIEELFRVKKFL